MIILCANADGARMNPLSLNRMSTDERLDEIAALLAAGLMRLRARKSSPLSRHDGESSLDFSADQRGHASTKGRQEHA
jgi:hypothetical protein